MSQFKLRQLEEQFYLNQDRQSWIAWLLESRRAGQPLFTSEALVLTTGGFLQSFQETPDGFQVEIEFADRPRLQFPVPVGPDPRDREYHPYTFWDGTLMLNYDEIQQPQMPYPTLTIDGEAVYSTAPYHSYHYRTNLLVYYGEPILSDAALIRACYDNSFYPLDKRGWDLG